MSEQVQIAEQVLDSEARSQQALRVHEVEPGEGVRVAVGFDREALSRLKPESLVGDDAWDSEAKAARIKATLDVYLRLPENMRFDAGITAIFGENGAGKTLLADVTIMALSMELYRQENGLKFGDRLLADYKGESGMFHPHLPGRLGSGTDTPGQEEHTLLVAKIAECMKVHEAALNSTKEYEVSSALRSPAALGNVAIGMSSRQAVDFLKGMQKDFRNKASIVLYDEPELGMSPRRQKQLVEELMSQSNGVIELVPSNSIVLFDSKLPRIDLDTPEKGVFEPSE